MKTLTDLVHEWEAEAQRHQDTARLGESPTEAAEAGAAADVFWKCAHQLTQALRAAAPERTGPDWDALEQAHDSACEAADVAFGRTGECICHDGDADD